MRLTCSSGRWVSVYSSRATIGLLPDLCAADEADRAEAGSVSAEGLLGSSDHLWVGLRGGVCTTYSRTVYLQQPLTLRLSNYFNPFSTDT